MARGLSKDLIPGKPSPIRRRRSPPCSITRMAVDLRVCWEVMRKVTHQITRSCDHGTGGTLLGFRACRSLLPILRRSLSSPVVRWFRPRRSWVRCGPVHKGGSGRRPAWFGRAPCLDVALVAGDAGATGPVCSTAPGPALRGGLGCVGSSAAGAGHCGRAVREFAVNGVAAICLVLAIYAPGWQLSRLATGRRGSTGPAPGEEATLPHEVP